MITLKSKEAVKDLNREVTVSPQLEMGFESSGFALEEPCFLSPHKNHLSNGNDGDSKDDNDHYFGDSADIAFLKCN